MSSSANCSGDPKNCAFCGETAVDCAKVEVNGCSANPASCATCNGKGCVALACTGDAKTCAVCKDNYTTCRKAQVSASEGIERAQKPLDA